MDKARIKRMSGETVKWYIDSKEALDILSAEKSKIIANVFYQICETFNSPCNGT
jgi:hypothetical protein